MSPLLVVQCKVGSLKPYAHQMGSADYIVYVCMCVCIHTSLCYICNKYKQRKSDCQLENEEGHVRDWRNEREGKSVVILFQLQIKYNWKQLSGAAYQLCIELRVSWWNELLVSVDVQCFVFRFAGPWRPISYSDKQCPFLGLGSKLSHFLKLNPEVTCTVSVLPSMSYVTL